MNTDNTNYTTKHKLNPGSIASYDLRPGNGVGLSDRKGKDGQKKKIGKGFTRCRNLVGPNTLNIYEV